MLEQWEVEAEQPAERIRSFIHILTANRALIKNYGYPVGTPSSELAKLNHASRAETNKLFTLFRTWLRRQFALLGREADADTLAMHLLARSPGGSHARKRLSRREIHPAGRHADDRLPGIGLENRCARCERQAGGDELEILHLAPSRTDERLAFLLG
jgi:TetR/AcrR family transcriptional repressor of nem operon